MDEDVEVLSDSPEPVLPAASVRPRPRLRSPARPQARSTSSGSHSAGLAPARSPEVSGSGRTHRTQAASSSSGHGPSPEVSGHPSFRGATSDGTIGDLIVAGPILEELFEFLPKLPWSSMLVVVTSTNPVWVAEAWAPEQQDKFHYQECAIGPDRWRGLSSHPWSRSPAGGGELFHLAFAARQSFAPHINIVADEVVDSGKLRWAAAQFVFQRVTSGLSSLCIGCVLAQSVDLDVNTSRLDHIASTLVEMHVRLIYVASTPLVDVEAFAHRLVARLERCISTSALAECCEVFRVASAYGASVQIIVLGRTAGFDGQLLQCVDLEQRGKLNKSVWKERVHQSGSLQGTLDMILPPATCKYLCRLGEDDGAFAGLWFKGHERRKEGRTQERNARRSHIILQHR